MIDLRTLSNEELEESLKRLKKSESDATLAILYHLIEIEDRGIFRQAGYSSLFDYCHRKLRYSEGAAGRRVSGARCLREYPELAGLLLEGKLSLCNIATAAKSIMAEETKIEEIVGKSKREVELLLAPPVERKPKERLRPIVLRKNKAIIDKGLAAESAFEENAELRYEIKFSVTKEVYEEFEELKNELSNKLGQDLSLEAVFTELIRARKANKAANVRKRSSSSSRAASTPLAPRAASRRIPASIKREVKSRDNSQCSYVAPDGTRCTAKRYLHYDHIKPVALGGKSVVDNLRMLCSVHNKLLAEEVFGRDKVHFYAGLKQKR